MDFFMSAEVDASVGDAEHLTRNKIDGILADKFRQINIDVAIERWTFISILFPEKSLSDYPEVIKHHKKKSVFEFRLHLPYEDFKRGSEQDRVSIMLAAIGRAIDLMREFQVSDGDRYKLRHTLADAQWQLTAH